MVASGNQFLGCMPQAKVRSLQETLRAHQLHSEVGSMVSGVTGVSSIGGAGLDGTSMSSRLGFALLWGTLVTLFILQGIYLRLCSCTLPVGFLVDSAHVLGIWDFSSTQCNQPYWDE